MTRKSTARKLDGEVKKSQSAEPEEEQAPAVPVSAVVCPLCVAPYVREPTVVHSTRLAGSEGTCEVCVVCKTCFALWAAKQRSPLCHDHTCPVCAVEVAVPDASTAAVALGQLQEQNSAVVQESSSGKKKGAHASSATAGNEAVLILRNKEVNSASGVPTVETACWECGSPSIFECVKCKVTMCTGCRQATHDSHPVLRDHPIHPIASRPSGSTTCGKHAGKLISVICLDCGTPMCVRCMDDHKGHQITSVEAAAENEKENKQRGIANVLVAGRASMSALQEADVLAKVQAKHQALRTDIENVFRSVAQTLKERETLLLAQVAAYFENREETILVREGALRRTMEAVSHVAAAFDATVSTRSDIEFLELHPLIHARLEQLAQDLKMADCGDLKALRDEFVVPLDSIQFRDVAGKAGTVSDVERAIRSIGEVVLPSRSTKPGAPLRDEDEKREPLPYPPLRVPPVASNGAPSADFHGKGQQQQQLQQSHLVAPSRDISTSLAISASNFLQLNTQMPISSRATEPSHGTAGGAVGAPAWTPGLPFGTVSKRKQYVNIADESGAGEPPRKTNARQTGATMAPLASLFAKRDPALHLLGGGDAQPGDASEATTTTRPPGNDGKQPGSKLELKL